MNGQPWGGSRGGFGGGGRTPGGFGLGFDASPPRDILVLLGTLFVTYSLSKLQASWVGYLWLTADTLLAGQLWRFATYSIAAIPSGTFWFLFSLLIIFWFGRDTYRALGRRGFWTVYAWGTGAASVTAILVDLLQRAAGVQAVGIFPLIQGQNIVLTVMIAAFATLYGNATIMLMFVLPVKARWFLWIEILFGFMGFLDSGDLGGFLGICSAVAVTYLLLTGGFQPGRLRGMLREMRLRIERLFLEQRIKRMRRNSNLRPVPPPDDNVQEGPWIN